MLAALQFLTLAMLEARPELSTADDLRAAAEMQGQKIHSYIERFRNDFSRTGQHAWDLVNAPPEALN
jgi:hypothetical protein